MWEIPTVTDITMAWRFTVEATMGTAMGKPRFPRREFFDWSETDMDHLYG